MPKKSLFQANPHLKGNKGYAAALRTSVLSSVAIEGVRKVAARAVAKKSSARALAKAA
jgi:hypothetical protein